MSGLALFYCGLLSLQFGLQPLLSSQFQDPSISKVGVVLITECAKIVIGLIFLSMESKTVRDGIKQNWSLSNSIHVAGAPAVLFAIQNVVIQEAFIRLDSLTFNLINQTKTLSNALWLYLLLNKKSSPMQVFALCLLFFAAVLLSAGDLFKFDKFFSLTNTDTNDLGVSTMDLEAESSKIDTVGLILTLSASALSGLSGALTQRAITSDLKSGGSPRNSFVFSMELATYGIIFLLLKELVSFLWFGGGLFSDTHALTAGWSVHAAIPVLANAFGGIIVGLVVKYAGGIAKGFALIVGILITALVQWWVENKQLTSTTWMASAIVCLSIYLHSTFPPRTQLEKQAIESKKQ